MIDDAIEDVAAILNNVINYGPLTRARIENNFSTVLRKKKGGDKYSMYLEGKSKSVLFSRVWVIVRLPSAPAWQKQRTTVIIWLADDLRLRGEALAARFSDSGTVEPGGFNSGEIVFRFEAGQKTLSFSCEDREPTYNLRSIEIENANPRDENAAEYWPLRRWWKFW